MEKKMLESLIVLFVVCGLVSYWKEKRIQRRGKTKVKKYWTCSCAREMLKKVKKSERET
jgi:hypothetical protein